MDTDLVENELPEDLGITHSTECAHVWAYAESDPNSNLISVACLNCWAGSSLDDTLFKLEDGKIVSR